MVYTRSNSTTVKLKKKNSFNEHKRATLKGDIKKRTVENHNNNKIY